MDIGKRIRLIREGVGLSGRALALKVGLDPSQINKIEHNVNKPSLEALERICDTLGISMGEFFADGQAPELPPEVRRVCGKIQQLPLKRLQILEAVLDDWIEAD